MEKFKLLGNRVLVKVPNRPKSKIEVDANTKLALEKAVMVTLGELEVLAVGGADSPKGIESAVVKVGDMVLVDPGPLTKSPKIEKLSTDEYTVVLISPFDIILIWK